MRRQRVRYHFCNAGNVECISCRARVAFVLESGWFNSKFLVDLVQNFCDCLCFEMVCSISAAFELCLVDGGRERDQDQHKQEPKHDFSLKETQSNSNKTGEN